MNTIHDIGGLDGLTLPERDQGRILKEEWERQVVGVALTAWSTLIPGYSGSLRVDIERIPPVLYLKMPYYAKWLWAEEVALIRSGLVTRDELENPDSAMRTADSLPYRPQDVVAYIKDDDSYEIPAEVPPRYAVGDEVIARNEHPAGHSRMPRYVRGRRGVIHNHHGVHLFQDEVDEDIGQQHLYTVKFAASELWGSRAHPNDVVYAELSDHHLAGANA
jgi:nitrile hydratase beta subunit